MIARPQHSIRLTGLAGLSLVLAIGGCTGDRTPGAGHGGGAGGGGTAAGGAATSAGGTVAAGGSPGSGMTGGMVAAGGSIQPAGGSTTAGSTSGAGGGAASGGSTATGGSKATGGATVFGGTSATGGETATGGVAATGGRTGGTTANGGTAGITVADAGMAGGTAAAGGRTGGTTVGGGSTSAGGTNAIGGNTGGSTPRGGTTSAGGTTASGGTTNSGDGGVATDTSGFRCVNWADTGDNFQNGVLQPSGLSAASDTYATVKTKSDAILSGFQTLLDANTVRIPINEPTVVTNASWWTAYKGIIDSAIGKNMKVIIGYWAINGGNLADANAFYTMWQTVIDAYVANDLVYFEIMNEPYALQPAAFIDFAVQWLARYPNVPKNRVVVAGNYTDTDVNQQGADPRLAGCLLSLHVYNYDSSSLVEQDWRNYLKTHVGPYYNRTIATEYGAVMTTGIDYSGSSTLHTPDPTPAINIAYMTGIPNQFRDWKMGSCLWVGLRNNDTTSITKLNGTGTDLSLTVTNESALARIKWGWGL